MDEPNVPPHVTIPAALLSAVKSRLRDWYFWVTMACCVAAMVVMLALHINLQWYWFVLFAALTVPFAPWIAQPERYYRGGLGDDSKNASTFSLLALSTFVSWVFAKSIMNASTLGASYGIVGGVAYAGWYTSFLSTAGVVYLLRRRGYRSLAEAIQARYGSSAAVAFGLVVLFRLFQEVWSNSLVVAGFYGQPGTFTWWAAAVVSTAIPAWYSITGGMRASLTTDVLQALLKIAFLVVVLVVLTGAALTDFGTWNPAGSCGLQQHVVPWTNTTCAEASVGGNSSLLDPVKATYTFTPASCNYTAIAGPVDCGTVGGTWNAAKCTLSTAPSCELGGGSWAPRDMWSLQGGLDLLLVALLQGLLSYPWFDPVLTDRAFLAAPRTMLGAFLVGGVMAAGFIILFSFLGIFGNSTAILAPETVPDNLFRGMLAGKPPAVAAFFGDAMYSVVNLIFIISSCAVLDSTFSSTAKLFGPEFMGVLRDGRPRPPQTATMRHVMAGRVAIVLLAVAGTLQLLANPTVLSATTVSGTMVVGLGPPVYALTFIKGYRPLVFHLPFWTGLAIGIVYQIAVSKDTAGSVNISGWAMGPGAESLLLGVNVISAAACWGAMGLALLENWTGGGLTDNAHVAEEQEGEAVEAKDAKEHKDVDV